MSLEDDAKPKSPPLTPLVDDLSMLSREELEGRISLLQAEIDRCRETLSSKKGALADAQAVFGEG